MIPQKLAEKVAKRLQNVEATLRLLDEQIIETMNMEFEIIDLLASECKHLSEVLEGKDKLEENDT